MMNPGFHDKVLAASLAFMAILTVYTLVAMFLRRLGEIRARRISIGQFRTYETEDQMPAHLLKASRHYKNLFEMPILFYVIVLFALVSKASDTTTSVLVIAFCLLRSWHTFIHLGANNVIHRMYLFAASLVSLICLWVYVMGKFFL